MMKTTRALAAALLLAAGAASARAAVVTLKDGGILLGNVVGQTSDAVELATPEGNLHIAVDRIQRIDYSEAELPAAKGAAGGAKAPRAQLLSLGFGLIQPVSRIDFHPIGGGSADDGGFGAQLGAQYVRTIAPRLGAGFDVDYFDRSGTVSPRLYPSGTASVGGDSWVMMGILRYSLTDHGRARPFLLAGAGGAYNTTTVDVRPAVWADTSTHETRRLIDDAAWVPAASIRAGVDVNIDSLDPGVLTFEVGWTGLASARYAATPQGAALGLSGVSGPLNILSFTARYGFRF
ncbi:MAG TPA: hypothetical protein VH309_11100 [Elusimicrobiota bacterium]|jgi:opacity protein-like surface antigen|nr:hypothetical protein [Elusimicrobiota bacterium]